jgi:hypothetical protein
MATVLDESLKTVLSEFGYDIDMIKKFLVECNCVITGDAVIKAKLMNTRNPPDLSNFNIKDLHIWIQTYQQEMSPDYKNIKNLTNFIKICNEYGFIQQGNERRNMFDFFEGYIRNIYYITPRYMTKTSLYTFIKGSSVEINDVTRFRPKIVKNRIILINVNAFYYKMQRRLNLYKRFDINPINEQDSIYPSLINNNFPEIECILNTLNKSFISEYKNYAFSGYIHNKINIKTKNNLIIAHVSLYKDTQLHFKDYFIIIYYIQTFFTNFFKKFPEDLKSYENIHKSVKYLYELLIEKKDIYYFICAWNEYAMKILNLNFKWKFINENFKLSTIIQDCIDTIYYNSLSRVRIKFDDFSIYDCIDMFDTMRRLNIPEIPYTNQLEQIFDTTINSEQQINYFRNSPIINPRIQQNVIDDVIPQNVIDESIRDQEILESQIQVEIKDIYDMLPIIPNIDDPNYNQYMKDLYRKYLNFFGIELKVPLSIRLRQKIESYRDKVLESPICNQGFDALTMSDLKDKRVDKVNEYLYEEYIKEYTDLTDVEKEEIKNDIFKNKIIGIYDIVNNKMYCILLNDEIKVLNNRKIRGIISNNREECNRLKIIQPSMYFLNFSIINRFYARNNLNYLPLLSNNTIHSIYLLLDTSLKWFDTNPNVMSVYHNGEYGDKLHLIVPLDLFDYE